MFEGTHEASPTHLTLNKLTQSAHFFSYGRIFFLMTTTKGQDFETQVTYNYHTRAKHKISSEEINSFEF